MAEAGRPAADRAAPATQPIEVPETDPGTDLTQLRGNLPAMADVCQAGGAALARLHCTAVRTDAMPPAPRPWVLQPARLPSGARRVVRGLAYAVVLEAYEWSPGLRAATDEVSERWTERHWIHGDLTPSSVLVAERPALRLWFAEPFRPGLGDPAWDVASALDAIVRLAPTWELPAKPLVDFFQQGYRRGSGPARMYPAMQAVRALATAWQVADATPRPWSAGQLAEVRSWLDRARGYAAGSVPLLRVHG